jgi:hypothetical protein
MGKMAQICQISNFKNSKSPESYDNFQKVAKNIKGFYFFLPSYLLHSQIWLNFFLDDQHHKILKGNPASNSCDKGKLWVLQEDLAPAQLNTRTQESVAIG